MSPAVPVPVVTPAPVVPVAVVPESTEAGATTEEAGTTATDGTAAADGTATDGTATDGTAPAVPVAPPAPTLFQVPLTLNVTGIYFELEQFINKLEGLKRSLLVTGFTLAPAPEAAEGSSASGPAPGDLSLVLQGRVFLSPAPAVTPATQPTPAVSTATGQ
jgi:hypothetical protein